MAGTEYMGIPREKIPWFPVIDEDKCTNCGSCLEFCDNDVFEQGETVMQVPNPYNCVVGCSTCQKFCDFDAITFPSKDELINWLKELRKR
ncbi:MAG: ferredoxin family protein [Bacteroidota bacterium]|nr:ferredoxin family protein [Bacteroidota bacterium]